MSIFKDMWMNILSVAQGVQNCLMANLFGKYEAKLPLGTARDRHSPVVNICKICIGCKHMR